MILTKGAQLRVAWIEAMRTGLRDVGSFISAFILFLLMGAVSACGGGGSGGSSAPDPSGSAPPELGQLVIGVTDAEGDFLVYDVAIEALTLTRQNGDIVEALPIETRINFTELTEVTEILSTATVPTGNYTSVTLHMDFSDAEVIVEDADGIGQAAILQDANGEPLTDLDVDLQLTTSDMIRISRGRPAAFSLDFDLAASNTVDTSVTPPVVTVDPMLLATPELETDRAHRVRGVIADVDETEQVISLVVRPLRHRQGDFGQFDVHVDDNTVYEVDGEGSQGSEGLALVATLPERAPLVALGRVNAVDDSRVFIAEEVLAGSSVPWADADVLLGVVAARSEDVLTLAGASIEFSDGRRAFRGVFAVEMSADTVVSAPGNNGHDITSVSVGQRVIVWGEFADDETVVADRVHMKPASLTGEVVATGDLAVDLFALSGRSPERYDFSGTGVDASRDADPDNYQIDTSVLPLASIEVGDLVRARGLVNAFGMAPPDFLARTVIDVQTDNRAGTLWVGWQEGTANPFSSIVPDRIDVDLADARAALQLRGVPQAYIDTLESVALSATTSGRGVYTVKVRGATELHLYRSFADLVDELIEQLDEGRLLHRITAQGRYNVGSSELTTGRAGFVFRAPDDV
ncbi:MAG: DUF4382 domain-containing protein [bacterium]